MEIEHKKRLEGGGGGGERREECEYEKGKVVLQELHVLES